jgi:hypothetical protein
MSGKPSVLLVHGAWHGPWYWERVKARLGLHGTPATAIALPSCGSDPATLPPDLQRVFAAQAGNTDEMASSHSPKISQPERLAGLIAVRVNAPALA